MRDIIRNLTSAGRKIINREERKVLAKLELAKKKVDYLNIVYIIFRLLLKVLVNLMLKINLIKEPIITNPSILLFK